MLELILSSSILLLLIYGTYTDIKNYFVSNRVSYSVILLRLPLLRISEFFWIQIVLSIILITAWHFKWMGSADVKVIVPIMFTLSEFKFLVFIGVMAIIGLILVALVRNREKEIPYYVPITTGYLSAVLLSVSVLVGL